MKYTFCECTADDGIHEEESRDGDIQDDDNNETAMFMTVIINRL
jgi:hypothetical protein